MTNNLKDRHVLAAAVGAQATHLVTSNLREFPETSVPDDIELIDPQLFLLRIFETDADETIEAVIAMADRRQTPPAELAERFANGRLAPRFGVAITSRLRVRPGRHGRLSIYNLDCTIFVAADVVG